MGTFFIYLYSFFHKHKIAFWALLVLFISTSFVVISKIKLEEDISKIMPSGDQLDKLDYAYDNTYLERSIKMQSLGSVKGEHSDGILTSIAFTLSNPHISVAIIGTKNPNHLLSNINIVNSLEPLDQSTLNELYNRFDQLDDNWKQLT